MRKIYSLVLMTAMLLVGTNAWADIQIVRGGEAQTPTYSTLGAALTAAIDGDVLELTGNVTNDAAFAWLGEYAPTAANYRSITLDLKGHSYTHNYGSKTDAHRVALAITHGELIIRSTGGKGTMSFKNDYKYAICVYGTYEKIDAKTQTPFSHLVIEDNVQITLENTVNGIGIDVLCNMSNVMPKEWQTNYQFNYTCNIFRDASNSSYGVANGARMDIYGSITSDSYAAKVNGYVRTSKEYLNNDGTPKTGYPYITTGKNPTSYTLDENDTHYAPYVHIGSTAVLNTVPPTSSSAVAAYSSGYARWLIEGTCSGSTGVYVKSGEVELNNATIESNYSGGSASVTKGGSCGVNAGGNAIVIESNNSYSGGQQVTVNGDTEISTDVTGGAAIVDVVDNDQETQVESIIINGGTLTGDKSIVISSETAGDTNTEVTVNGVTVIGLVEVGDNTGAAAIADIMPSGTHTTEVENADGTTTVIVSTGSAPGDYDTWADVPADADVNWKGTAPVVIGDGTTATEFSLGELQITNGGAGTEQYMTIKNNATLTVERLIMNDYARITVEAGGKLIINGSQGISAPSANNITLQASETSQAMLLFSPSVTSNRQPNATVQVYTYAKQNSATSFTWQRLVSPLATVTNITSNGAGATLSPGDDIGTYRWWLEHWSYTNTAWTNITSFDQIKAFDCLNLTNNTRDGGITYSFVGYLQGTVDNTIKFKGVGYNYFGNSYTAPMSLTEIATTLDAATNDIDHSIWLWDRSGRYVSANAYTILNDGYTGSLEIPALHSFIMKQLDANVNMDLNYTNTVWNYNMGITPNPVVARANNNINAVRINIASSEGDEDYVFIAEDENLTADYDNGVDASKLMQTGRINFYVMAENDNLSICGTNDIVGTMLSLETQNDINYTLTFSNVRGEVYALRDNLTNAIVLMNEGATYNFTAQPNATLDGRFQIVSRQEMPTAVETIEETVAPKAIYTIMGQYVGETTDWNNLPAGVYVVDGVKVIK